MRMKNQYIIGLLIDALSGIVSAGLIVYYTHSTLSGLIALPCITAGGLIGKAIQNHKMYTELTVCKDTNSKTGTMKKP